MVKKKSLSIAAASALGMMTSGFLFPALAQEEEVVLEEIIITGTRIRQANLTSISPVTTVTAEDFKLSGTTRVEDLINDLPQVRADFGGNVANGATGAASVDLRGLGAERTLVMVNSRRLMPGDPTQDGGGTADLNQIPGALIERVEVLTGGASAVYGADAVAGVVNFIMVDDFEGVRLDWQSSGYQHDNDNSSIQQTVDDAGFPRPSGNTTDGNTIDVTLTMGINTDDGRGNATFYLGYRRLEELLQASRDYSTCALNSGDSFRAAGCGGSSTSAPARFQQVIQTGDEIGTETGMGMTPRGPSGALREFDGGTDLFNFAPLNHYQRPDKRYTAGVFTHFDLNEQVTAYGEFQFMDDSTDAQIAPSGAFRGSGPAAFNGAYAVNCANPFLNASEFDFFCTQQGLTADDDALISIGRRGVEGGGRSNDLGHTSYRAVFGFKGDVTESWSYDAYVQYGRTNYESTYFNDYSKTRIGNALLAVTDANGDIVCRVNADDNVTNDDLDCVPWNIFSEGGVTPEALDYVSVPGFQNGRTEETIVSGSISGDLTDYGLKLPWADTGLGIAFGAEYREEKSEFLNDVAFASGDLLGQGGKTLDISGNFDVNDLFVEARLPVVEGAPWAEVVSVEAGYRYSDYSLGFSTDTYKFGADWTPVDDIRLRGSYQRAVRAPNVVELFRPQGVQLDGSTDPCAVDNPGAELPTASNAAATLANCLRTGLTAAQYGQVATNPAGQYNGRTGGNPDLEPESADTYSFGFVFAPRWVEGLNITVDYYDIKIEEVIDEIGADLIVNSCLTSGEFCDLVNRSSGGSLWLGERGFIVNTNQNLGSLQATGIDANIAYTFDMPGSLGSLNLNLLGSYVEELTTEPLEGFPKYDCSGLFGSVCEVPTPKWVHKARAYWATPWNFDLALTWRHIDSVDNENTRRNSNFSFGQFEQTDKDIRAFDYLDVTGQYNIDTSIAKFTIRAGVENVTDKEPPLLGQDINVEVFSSGNTFPQVYDTLGRYWFFSVSAAL